MSITLGIDTGGTYTDAVLVDQENGAVLAGAKALTTYHDLSIGIGEAVAAVFAAHDLPPGEVNLVGLSTTLATNAIVEGRGSSVCLLLIGYDPDLIRQYGFERELVTDDVVYLAGGHDVEGNEVEPLNEAAVRQAILARRDRVEAFAVSGYFGVRNPAHELRVLELIEELTDDGDHPLPVTSGHELTTRLNSIRRATTAALNARLIPLLQELIATVRQTLDDLGVSAPLMVVKGDGSLVRADWALRRPIETILSGPAASVVGAWHLAGRRDVWVVDVGGTTTDIATLRDGRARLNVEGAQVGRWRTMVEAVDAHTVGLGGDSLVAIDEQIRLAIGPRRVIPLSTLAATHPQVLEVLRYQAGVKKPDRPDLYGRFALAQGREVQGLSPDHQEVLDLLEDGPRPLTALVEEIHYGSLALRRLEELESRRLVLRSGFTPTDALHVLGIFRRWDDEAARLGAQMLAARLGISVEALCQRVTSGVSDRVTTALVSKVLSDEVALPDWEGEPAAAAMLERALGNCATSDLSCQLALRQPVVAVGAPVSAYMPRVADQLSTELVIPEHAGVANAVGAVVGGVVLQQRVLIVPIGMNEHFRIFLPEGVRDAESLEEAVTHAQAVVPDQLRRHARQAGADHVEIKVARHDLEGPVHGGWGRSIHLETELIFTAVGRPSPVMNGEQA
jgi:N-methylhydantoinase A/oxoprolinase/acetone carboxylase beta subunit